MPSLGAHQLSFEEQKQRAADIVRLLSMYINILDSYVIEFFSENLWEKVPRSWRPTLSALTAPQLASLLLENRSSAGQESVWPLSLLAFRAAAHGLALPRQPRGVSPPREAIPGSSREPEEFQANKSQSSRLGHLFRKHVRPKKQHEIRRLAGLVKKLCNATGCEHVVDMGSGQGVRELSLHSLDPPRHLVHQVLSEEEGKLLEELGQGQGSPPLVLAALHACGDLGPAALRLFAQCPGARGLALVSCCYMKASEEGGYPMSAWVRSLPAHQLPYKLRETACHAVEDFAQRLRGQSPALRSHCYRAALEVIIRHLHPHLRRPPLHAGGKAHLLPFPDYAREGLRKLGLHSGMSWDVAQVEALLEQGNKVLAYFCLTLSLAPVIETLILLDRVIYLQEQGFHCQLLPLFEPRFSPRNFVLLAAKLSGQLSQLLCPADGASCPK
ncbi:methyltransferase-like protein 25B isoform X4 [Mobula birostris]|uniref:methyltransferase-like protein 25B isoform X4 n=1 Tax=Mobula birostris TaxID=1983395 RepID=UPI003B27CA35